MYTTVRVTTEFLATYYGGGQTTIDAHENDDRLSNARVGLTLGGQKYHVIFLMQDSETFDRFVNNGWYADASARAAAGREGGASGTAFVNGLAIFQLNQGGLMASLDISSTWYSKDDELN